MGGPGSGRGGISPAKVDRAERLLAAGWSARRVAREIGVHHNTVDAIAAGVHFLQLARDQRRYARCACGALTDEQPCKLCQLRAAGL